MTRPRPAPAAVDDGGREFDGSWRWVMMMMMMMMMMMIVLPPTMTMKVKAFETLQWSSVTHL